MESARQKNITPVLIVLAIVTGGYLLSTSLLESLRPEAPKQEKLVIDESKVHARLWQDPFMALSEHKKYNINVYNDPNEYTLQKLRDRITKTPDSCILLVMVRDGTFAEDYERRLRNRYAVVTALHSSGLIPEDSESLCYLSVGFLRPKGFSKNLIANRLGNTVVIPYEWFIPECRKNTPEKDVVVLWLPESVFLNHPMVKLAHVIRELGKGKSDTVKLIGPSRSATLQAMIQSVQSGLDDPNAITHLDGLQVFLPWSTVSPSFLYSQENSQSSQEAKKPNITFVRTIGTDDRLAKCLINELSQRGVDVVHKKDRIALITEWDTLYGRSFPLTFANVMHNKGRVCSFSPCDPSHKLPFNLECYSYIRGVDGRLPDMPDYDMESKEDVKKELDLTYDKCPEMPVGRSQLDYIRRLAITLGEGGACPEKGKIRAIGVIGSDVYDKILLFQALRVQLKNVILFTVDLDARLAYHDNFPWTRNVIVASNYGLEYKCCCGSESCSHTIQFRDNYQASLYRSCLIALGKCKDYQVNEEEYAKLSIEEQLSCQKQIPDPKLYEIGRGHAVELSGVSFSLDPSKQKDSSCFQELIMHGKRSIKAAAMLIATNHKAVGHILIIVIPLGILLCFLSSSLKKTFLRIVIWIVIAGIPVGFLACIIYYDHSIVSGEPFSFVSGTSIWPGSILRLTAIILSIFFLVKGGLDLYRNKQYIGDEYNLGNISRRFCYRINLRLSSLEKKEEKTVDAEVLWGQYDRLCVWYNHLARSLLGAVLFGVAVGCTQHFFDDSLRPFRGNISKFVDSTLSFLCMILMVFLMFYVIDAIQACIVFIKNLKTPITVWPYSLIREQGQKSGLRKNILSELLDIKLIAAHTEVVGGLIYYPSIILFVMILARSRFFDNWAWPAWLVVAYIVALGAIVCCEMVMRHEAEKSRAQAIDRLNNELIKAEGRNSKKVAAQLKLAINEIQEIKKGAFSSHLVNPVIHAILIPSGGTTLLMLLNFFLAS